MAVFAAKSSKLDAVSTTESLSQPPPNCPPSSETKRSELRSLTSFGTSEMANSVSTGEVAIIVTMTRRMPFFALSLMGSFIAGLSWLMLSRPENASQAPEKPTRKVERSRSFARARFCCRAGKWKSGALNSVTTTTIRLTTMAAAAMTKDSAALSRMPMKLTTANNSNAATDHSTMLCSTAGTIVPR